MNLWLIFAIALAAMITALVLAYVLKSRLSDNDVWEELIDPNGSVREPQSASSAPPLRETQPSRNSAVAASQLKVEPMPIPTSTPSSRSFRGADLRRSSRIEQPISLVVMGTNRRGESFQENTAALSCNLHGCRYSSRHDYPNDSWVILQVTGTDGRNSPVLRARVRSVVLPNSPRELSQVGVELETPGNVWGVREAPEDWDRLLPSSTLPGRATMGAPAVVSASAETEDLFEHPPTLPERKAEVTVFPSPVAPPEPPTAAKEPAAAKPDRVVLTPDQLLQALQGKLQQAADRAVQTAISTHLNDSVRIAIAKIDDVWKSNVRQAEEFSNARLGEVQNRWERELVVYRSRAEEVSRRLETLAASSQHSLGEWQKLAQQLKNEIAPQLEVRLKEFLERAKSAFAANAAEISGQHINQLSETAQTAAQEARVHFDERLAQMRALASTAAAAPPAAAAGISDERLDEVTKSSRQEVVQQVEQRLSEIWGWFEKQQDQARQRTDEIAALLSHLTAQFEDAKSSQERAIAEVRSFAATSPTAPLPPEQLETHLQASTEKIHNHLEWRLGEISAKFEQLHTAARQDCAVLADRLDALTGETSALRAQHEQGLGELRATLASLPSPVSQERLDWLLNSTREQLLKHLEWRIGELSDRSAQQHDVTRQHAEELAQRFATLAANTRAQLDEARALAENSSRTLRSEDLGKFEQTVDRAAREFESTAARASDRQLVRLNEQKQALANETSLELEARASEARVMLQKTANQMLDEFRHRVQMQIDLGAAEATERVTSTLASLDAENRAVCEARRRGLESDVARAAEQSAAEFRSGIKAFLYSCLVAAVSAVDQHAQTTLAGLNQDALPAGPSLENTGGATAPQNLSSAANASATSPNPAK
jgi:hypothetical protein